MLLTVSQTSTSNRTYDEDLIGAINGANTVFTTSQKFVAGSETVYFNGVRQREGAFNDYVRSESGGLGTGYDTITLAVAPRSRVAPRVSDTVTIDYDQI